VKWKLLNVTNCKSDQDNRNYKPDLLPSLVYKHTSVWIYKTLASSALSCGSESWAVKLLSEDWRHYKCFFMKSDSTPYRAIKKIKKFYSNSLINKLHCCLNCSYLLSLVQCKHPSITGRGLLNQYRCISLIFREIWKRETLHCHYFALRFRIHY
jgi:hypothetical protein